MLEKKKDYNRYLEACSKADQATRGREISHNGVDEGGEGGAHRGNQVSSHRGGNSLQERG